MKRTLTCIICPRGCTLNTDIVDGKVSVSGHTCPKGLSVFDGCEFIFQTIHDRVSLVLPDHAEDHSFLNVQTQNIHQLRFRCTDAADKHLEIDFVLAQNIQIKLTFLPIHNRHKELQLFNGRLIYRICHKPILLT